MMALSAARNAQSSCGATVIVVGDDRELMEELVDFLTHDGYAVLGLPPVYGNKLLKYIESADFLLWTDMSALQLETTLRQLPGTHRGVQCIGLRNRAISAVTAPGVRSMFLVSSLMRAGIKCPHKLYLSLELAAA
jgi:hypothetical protein